MGNLSANYFEHPGPTVKNGKLDAGIFRGIFLLDGSFNGVSQIHPKEPVLVFNAKRTKLAPTIP